MSSFVRAALIQTTGLEPVEAMLDRQSSLLREAAGKGAQVACLQELATGPYFCQTENPRWFDLAEEVPDGPTITAMQDLAKELNMVLVVTLYEKADGFYYNTASVIDSDGSYLGKYRKNHIPHGPNFQEKYYFKPGNLGYPVFDTAVGKIGVYICYDRHFPEGARALCLNGAELVFIPAATAGRSRKIWFTEQRGHAIANIYFVGTINRVGVESEGPNEFYGHSYFCDPYGEIIAEAGESEEVLIADLDLASVRETRIELLFWRDRRPDTYDAIAAP